MEDLALGARLKHERLKSILLEALDSGEFQPGDQLPSQNDMAARYAVSHNTVREALASLVHEGRLYRVQGKGTFVTSRKAAPTSIAVMMPHLYMDPRDTPSEANIVPRLVSCMEGEARVAGANIVLYLHHDDPTIEVENLEELPHSRVNAAIVFCSGDARAMRALKQVKNSGLPTVLVDRYCEGDTFDYVGTDNLNGAYEAVKAMCERGFTNVVYIDQTDQGFDSTTHEARRQGYAKACREFGVKPHIENMAMSLYRRTPREVMAAQSWELARRLSKGKFAVFAQNAHNIQWFCSAVRDLGLRHDHVALGCFDEPQLQIPDGMLFVKVIQPLEAIGRRSVQIAMGKIQGSDEFHFISLDPEVTIVNDPLAHG